MVGNINDIKAHINLSAGIAQPCHYVVNINPPLKMIESLAASTLGLALPIVGAAQRHISMMCESASLPGRQILTTEHKMYATMRKMPYGYQYEDFTCTFICSNMFWERIVFDIWQSFIISAESQYMNYYQDYVGEIVVAKLSDDPLVNAMSFTKYTLQEAYPVSIQSQDLGYAETDYMRLTVQFAYAKWSAETEKWTQSWNQSGVEPFGQ